MTETNVVPGRDGVQDIPVKPVYLSGSFQVALGALIISFAPVLVKISSVGPTMAGFYRTLFGAGFLILITLFHGNPMIWRIGVIIPAGLSALFFALGLTCWHRSILAIGPGLSTIMANFQVFFLAIIGTVLFKERLDPRRLAAMILAGAGIYFLVGMKVVPTCLNYRSGVFLGLSAAVAYALFVVALRKLQTSATARDALANFAVVSLLCAVFMGFEGWMQGESFHIPDQNSWLAMIALGIFCQALGWVLISKGLPFIATSRAGLLLLLQPTGAFLWDILIFQRTTTGWEYFGAALALTGIYLGTRWK